MDSASICGHQMDTEFGFYLPEHKDVSPIMQTNFVRILGRHGLLNLSKQNGQVYYDSIEREWRFEKVTRTTSNADVDSEKRILRNALLGESGQIILDDDPDYYYEAFVTSIDVSCENNGKIVAIIKAMTDPFKYKVELKEYSHEVNQVGWTIGIMNNGRMPAVVNIENDFEVEITYSIDGTMYTATFDEGTHVLNNIALLPHGTTVLSIHGVDGATGNITISFREGYL